MKTKLTLFVTVIAVALFGMGLSSAAPIENANSNPPSNALEFNKHRYLILHSAKGFTWEDANKIAQALGGHLPYVETKEENDFLRSILNDAKWGFSIPLGATDSEKEGVWKWGNGKLVKWTDWATGQPSNSGNEDRLALNTPLHKRWKTGTWNDADGGWITIVIEFE